MSNSSLFELKCGLLIKKDFSPTLKGSRTGTKKLVNLSGACWPKKELT